MHAKCSGVDLHALDHSKVADKDSELASPDSGAADDAHNRLSGLLPDWTRSALEEVLGPLAETATLLQIPYAGRSEEAHANVGGR